jgi:hypothetical protein
MHGTAWFLRLVALGATALAAGGLASSAGADGLPVLGVDAGSAGVAARTSPVRYVTLPATGETIVARTAAVGGRILRFARLRGTFTIPAVAYDGSASGLSADGARLVLIQPRLAFPRAETAFAVLDARRLQLRGVIHLRGDYSFDAISPDGATMFLIQYVSPTDPTRYNVRAFDLRAWRLLPHSIVDPHEQGTAMRGAPLSRATSEDGRWAYTLYDGAGGTPFVHALDTSNSRARCVDLPLLAGRRDLWQLRLARDPAGGKLRVGTAAETVALVDTTDFRVSRPVSAAGRHPDRPWELFGAAALAALLAALAALLAVRRRSGAAPTEPEADGRAPRSRAEGQPDARRGRAEEEAAGIGVADV